jgi:hypothetical protein
LQFITMPHSENITWRFTWIATVSLICLVFEY